MAATDKIWGNSGKWSLQPFNSFMVAQVALNLAAKNGSGFEFD